jgi:hypothetical protein
LSSEDGGPVSGSPFFVGARAQRELDQFGQAR